MHSIEQALAEILARVAPLAGREAVPLSAAVGRVLAVEVVSDVDLPPFEKSAMDGFAVHSSDFRPERAPAGERTLPILGESRAGEPFQGPVEPGCCVEIFTGAELPADCDAVVMVERSEPAGALEGAPAVVLRDQPSAGQHVCHRGQDLGRGQTVLRPGRRLRTVDLAVLASVGCDPVGVFPRPRVAVVTSGDELVPTSVLPGRGQIREGNTYHLSAMARAVGADARNLGVVRDDPAELEETLRAALDTCDVLVTTGGVSMGKYDLVGAALEAIGVEPVFHKVAIKPGKPLWFGARGDKPVFALPGNPVSCLVNHEVFVRPALERLSGLTEPRLERRGRWGGDTLRANPREQYLPVRLRPGDDGVEELEPVRWNGSADVVGIARAEALAIVPAASTPGRGELLRYRPLD